MLLDYSGIEKDRWGKGIDHDPRSEKMFKVLEQVDWDLFNDSLGWKSGGDGDNGEQLLYALDVYFELLDRGRLPILMQ